MYNDIVSTVSFFLTDVIYLFNIFQSIDDSAIDSTQSPDTKKPSASPDQSEESIKRNIGDPQVGSTVTSDNTVSTVQDNEDVDMAPESSSEAVRRGSVGGEAESVEVPSCTTPVTPQNNNKVLRLPVTERVSARTA